MFNSRARTDKECLVVAYILFIYLLHHPHPGQGHLILYRVLYTCFTLLICVCICYSQCQIVLHQWIIKKFSCFMENIGCEYNHCKLFWFILFLLVYILRNKVLKHDMQIYANMQISNFVFISHSRKKATTKHRNVILYITPPKGVKLFRKGNYF